MMNRSMRTRNYDSVSSLINSEARRNINNRVELTYSQVMTAQCGNVDEQLVDVRKYDPTIIAISENNDMQQYTGNIILVRDSVARKLRDINKTLEAEEGLNLRVAYGYRHPKVQEEYFNAEKEKQRALNPNVTDAELNEITHNYVAYPRVAGHTTGGAVDLTLVRDGVKLDMGTPIYHDGFEHPEMIPTFGDGLTGEQFSNRMKLQEIMTRFGFVPFLGEWWHFSYGDFEWAAYSGYGRSLYCSVEL